MEKETNANSPQFIRTDKAIINAMISLLNKKSFDQITVHDILEETPVSRATFYAHYHDKYEVVERMQMDFFRTIQELSNTFKYSKKKDYATIIKHAVQSTQDLSRAIRKVHTDRVDVRVILEEKMKMVYLADCEDSDTKQAEAAIYAQVFLALEETIADSGTSIAPTSSQIDEILMNVMLRFFGLHHDSTVKDYLREQIVNANKKRENAADQRSPQS